MWAVFDTWEGPTPIHQLYGPLADRRTRCGLEFGDAVPTFWSNRLRNVMRINISICPYCFFGTVSRGLALWTIIAY